MKQTKKFFQSDWRFMTIVDLVPQSGTQKYEITTIGISPIRTENSPVYDYTACILIDLSKITAMDNLEKAVAESESQARHYAISKTYDWMQHILIHNGFEPPIEYEKGFVFNL